MSYLSQIPQSYLNGSYSPFDLGGYSYTPEIAYGQGETGVGDNSLQGYYGVPTGQGTQAGMPYGQYDASGRFTGGDQFQSVNNSMWPAIAMIGGAAFGGAALGDAMGAGAGGAAAGGADAAAAGGGMYGDLGYGTVASADGGVFDASGALAASGGGAAAAGGSAGLGGAAGGTGGGGTLGSSLGGKFMGMGASALLNGGAAGLLAGAAGGGKGGGQQYVPTGLGAADNIWQGSAAGSYGDAQSAQNVGQDAFQRSYDAERGQDFSGYLGGADRAGAAYGRTGDMAMGQADQYGQQARTAIGQQGAMYDASGRVIDTAFDPQHALYDRSAQQLQDQIRAGQAARGLGTSEAGMMEEAGAMGNFNIDWQNAQLARQATGIQAAGSAQNAGMGQGRLAGADMSAGLAAGAAGAGYYGQSGQVPMDARSFVNQQPGAAAGRYVAGMGGVQQMYGNAQAGAIPYMNAGNGAIQGNYNNQYQQNRDMAGALGQIGQAAAPTVAGWFGNGAQGAFSQTAMGGGGFGTGMAYGNQDMGQYL